MIDWPRCNSQYTEVSIPVAGTEHLFQSRLTSMMVQPCFAPSSRALSVADVRFAVVAYSRSASMWWTMPKKRARPASLTYSNQKATEVKRPDRVGPWSNSGRDFQIAV